MSYFLGLDIGTSSAKAAVVDVQGGFHGLHQAEYDISSPHSGWSEQDPELWWQAACTAIRGALAGVPGGAGAIAAMAVSSQMHTLVPLDRDGRPVRPAILHNDARTAREMAEMREKLGPGAEAELCNPICNGMTVPSLLWMRRREPAAYGAVAHVLLPADYLRLRLTGEYGCDHSNASSTLAYDVRRCGWNRRILEALELSEALFPPCGDSTDLAGTVTARAADQCGLAAGTPVYFGGADQVMQSIGCGAIRPGQATVNLGSGAQICLQTDRLTPAPERGINAFVSYRKGKWYTLAANSNGGSAFKWFCRSILRERDYAAVDDAAAALPPGADGLLFLPYLNGERCPHRNPDLSGCFLGLTGVTDPARMARAIMEGITFSLLDCLNACRAAGFSPEQLIALGGGAHSDLWMQIQADIYGLPLLRPRTREQAVFGAAICAAVGSGAFASVEDACAAMVPDCGRPVLPNPQNQAVYARYYACYRRFFQAAGPLLEDLTKLGRV